MSKRRIVTLTTDFGLSDPFASILRGVVLSINPEITVLDISHEVPSFDLLDGALTIASTYHYYPSGTIHVVVVDPGVGSARRPILVTTQHHQFVAPDNGVLSPVYQREESVEVRHVTAEHFFLQPVSQTFHGRDVFAPVAAWLSRGVRAEKFGDVVTDYVRLNIPAVQTTAANTVTAVVLKVDKFGNLITNLTPESVPQLFQAAPPAFRLTVGSATITQVHASYSEGNPGELFAIVGSLGFLEIAANRASAAQVAQAGRGAAVQVSFD